MKLFSGIKVDDEMYDFLQKCKTKRNKIRTWRMSCGTSKCYVKAFINKHKKIRLDWLVYNLFINGLMIDPMCENDLVTLGSSLIDDEYIRYMDDDPLNLTATNLFIMSKHEMHCNAHRPNKTSQYFGVNRCTKTSLWRARVQIDGKQICIGSFEHEKDAAVAYNKELMRHGLPCVNWL